MLRDDLDSLDLIGIFEGTDKSSLDHAYLRIYDSLFNQFRDREFNLLEIGVFNGASLRMWKQYFPAAHIIGIDINPQCKSYETDRISIEVGSQDDPAFLSRLTANRVPFIVIDDGSHIARHIMSSFEQIFPQLMPGGFYVVEDAFVHYGPEEGHYSGSAQVPLREYFSRIAESQVARTIHPADAMARYLYDQVAWIGFMRGAIVVQKRAALPVAKQLILRAENLVAQSRTASHWYGAAGVLLSNGGSFERAESMVRRAIELDDSQPEHYVRLGQVLERQGRVQEAFAAYMQATELSPGLGVAWRCAGAIKSDQGDHNAAVQCFRRYVDAHPTHPEPRRVLSEGLARAGDLPGAIAAAEKGLEIAGNGPFAEELRACLAKLRGG